MTLPQVPPPAVLRPLVPADLDRVMELEPILFGRGAWSRRAYDEELRTEGRTYVAADAGGLLVGYAGLAGGDEAQVMTVGVDPAFRCRGIGAQLLDALLALAGEEGARSILLEVRAGDPVARRLYERAGFAEIGRRRRYYGSEDAVVMRLQLRRGPGPVGAELAER